MCPVTPPCSSQRTTEGVNPLPCWFWIAQLIKVAAIRKYIFPMVLETNIAQYQNHSYEGTTKINLWLGIPRTMRKMCFLMVATHRLRTTVLNYLTGPFSFIF